jgi:methionine-rich copper-binding protein CopC
MNHHKFVKSTLAAALLALSSGAYAHSILNGDLPANPSLIDVYRTTCFKADGTTPLKDATGSAWTLPMHANAYTTDDTASVVFGLAKTDSNSGNLYATVAISNAGNVSCDPNATGALGNDCASNPGANANNILPPAAGTSTFASVTTSTHVTEWETLAPSYSLTADDEPPATVSGITVTGWATTNFQPAGPDQNTANGEYVIIISHDSSPKAHSYDFLLHCVNGNTTGSADSAHTGQGSMFQNQGDGTIANSADYDMVLDNGAGF